MGPIFNMPPPLLPRLDLPYFTVIHYWIKGSGENCLYVTAAPPDGAELATGDLAEPEPYPFERVAYGQLLRHLGEHPLLQPLLDLHVKPNLRGSLLRGASVVPLEEISSGRVLERPVGLNGQGLERLQVVILRTPAGPSFNPRSKEREARIAEAQRQYEMKTAALPTTVLGADPPLTGQGQPNTSAD